MSIQRNRRTLAAPPDEARQGVKVGSSPNVSSSKVDDPLVFTTLNARKPALVDLREFSTGKTAPGQPAASKIWGGGFTGRAELILEMAPAIRDNYRSAAKALISNLKTALRYWWRLLDQIEDSAAGSAVGTSVRSVAQLSHLHAELARKSATKRTFTIFTRLANRTRKKQGLPELMWRAPEEGQPCSSLAAASSFRPLFHAIRRGWYAALDRWAHIDQLLAENTAPESEADTLLLQNGVRFRNTRLAHEASKSRHPRPADFELQFRNESAMQRAGFAPKEVYSHFYPTAKDVRMAFHLAISGCGWNVSTMLDLEVDCTPGSDPMPFLRDNASIRDAQNPHARTRYILTGHKNRGDSYHDVHGYWESMRSPGVIVKTIVERTWPLRMELLRQAEETQKDLVAAIEAGTDDEADALQRKLRNLIDASTRVWIYWDGRGIQCLSGDNFSASPTKGTSWLAELVAEINVGLTAERQVPKITASDFRDLYAMWVYEATGGNLLAVSRALNHRRLTTTARYLWSRLLNRLATNRLVKFEDTLWREILEKRRIDSTVLRELMEQGHMSDEHSIRLHDYRKLKKSRLNAGCAGQQTSSSPVNPSEKIDEPCVNHRCSICHRARIGFDSRDGFAMRFAELTKLQSVLPMQVFIWGEDASLAHERDMTLQILQLFDSADVSRDMAHWTAKIESGEHLIPELLPG